MNNQQLGDYYKSHFYNYLKSRNVDLDIKQFNNSKFAQSCLHWFATKKRLSSAQISSLRFIASRSSP